MVAQAQEAYLEVNSMFAHWSRFARPRKHILEGDVREDVFAASLSAVVDGTAGTEYLDSEKFWQFTYVTKGLERLLNQMESVFAGKSGDNVVSLETPFGGGKTHTLIAAYHKAKELGAEVVAFDGSKIDARDITPWEYIEKSLTGKIDILEGKTAPGQDRLKQILDGRKVLILIDELTTYATSAATVHVGKSTLAEQVNAFIHNLTSLVSSSKDIFLIITIPSSKGEEYSTAGATVRDTIEKTVGRVSMRISPVENDEVYHVIRRRLFESIDKEEAESVARQVSKYLREQELIAPEEENRYREKFALSYPFMPDLIDIFRDRWAIKSNFQRTRSVLKIFSLILRSMLEEKVPFIRPGDVVLQGALLDELVQYTGIQFEAVCRVDITDVGAGAKKVDEFREADRSYKFGTSLATTMFLYSFPQEHVKKHPPTEDEIFRGAIPHDLSISPLKVYLADYIEQLRRHLKYLSDEGLYFTGDINIHNLALEMASNIEDAKVEPQVIRDIERSMRFSEVDHATIKGRKEFKPGRRFAIIPVYSEDEISQIFENLGGDKNMVAFAVIDSMQLRDLMDYKKRVIVWEKISKDPTYKSKWEVAKREHGSTKETYREKIARVFDKVVYPIKPKGVPRIDFKTIAITDFNSADPLENVWKALEREKVVKRSLAPQRLKDVISKVGGIKYDDLVGAFRSSLEFPKVVSEDVIRDSVLRGVREGIFKIAFEKVGDMWKSCSDTVDVAEEDYVILPEKCVEENEEHGEEMVAPSSDEEKDTDEDIPDDIFHRSERREEELIESGGSEKKIYRTIAIEIDINGKNEWDISYVSRIRSIINKVLYDIPDAKVNLRLVIEGNIDEDMLSDITSEIKSLENADKWKIDKQ